MNIKSHYSRIYLFARSLTLDRDSALDLTQDTFVKAIRYAHKFQEGTNYTKPGDKILDTHLGSGSSRIACYEAGYDFTGFEVEESYYQMSEERFQKYISQGNMFRSEVQKQAQQEVLL